MHGRRSSGFSLGGFATRGGAHAEVLAELCGLVAVPQKNGGPSWSTSSHVALSAKVALQSLSTAGKNHLREHGGLLAVVEPCAPLFESRSGPTRTADDTVVLVDLWLATTMCAKLGLPRREVKRRAPPDSVRDAAAVLERTLAWGSAKKRAFAAFEAVAKAEEQAVHAVSRGDPARAARDLAGRASAGAAREPPAHIEPYMRQATATALFGALQVLCSAVAWRNEADRRAAIPHLLSTVKFLSTSASTTAAQRATLAMWRNSLSLEQSRSLDRKYQPLEEKPRSLDEKQTGFARVDDDVVVLGEKEKPSVAHPVIDLTRPRFVRFVDDVEARPSRRHEAAAATLADAEAKGRGRDDWLAEQRAILERRVDRAIWEAFRTADFDPLLSLLDHGVSPAYVREKGGCETALMAAAYHGHVDACKALLARGADVAACDRFGHTAVNLARKKQHIEVAALLEGARNRGPEVDLKRPASPHGVPKRSPKRRRKGDDPYPTTTIDDQDDVRTKPV